MDLLTDCHSWFKCEDNEANNNVDNEIWYNADLLGGKNTEDVSQAGKFDRCFLLVANDGDYIKNIDYDVCDPGSGDWTSLIWIKVNNPQTGMYLLDKRVGPKGYRVYWYGAEHSLIATCNNGSDNYVIVGTTDLDDGDWHSIFIERNNGTFRMYIDNVVEGTPVSGVIGDMGTSGLLYIGCRNDVNYHWNAYIDQFIFWQRALSDSERKWLWNNGNGQPGLVGLPRPLVGGALAHGRKGLVA